VFCARVEVHHARASLHAPGFDYATIQWDELLKTAVMATMTYLSKNLLTTKDGKFGGIL
jgi:hypothetical protein